jgi:hypothetical protein
MEKMLLCAGIEKSRYYVGSRLKSYWVKTAISVKGRSATVGSVTVDLSGHPVLIVMTVAVASALLAEIKSCHEKPDC